MMQDDNNILYVMVMEKKRVTTELMLMLAEETAGLISPVNMSIRTIGNGNYRKYNAKTLRKGIENEELKKDIRYDIGTAGVRREYFSVSEGMKKGTVIFTLVIGGDDREGAADAMLHRLMVRDNGMVASKCSSHDDFLQMVEQIDMYECYKELKDVRFTYRSFGNREKIIDTEYNPGHHHWEDGAWFGSCYCMWFGKDYYRYIPKERLQAFSNCYENTELDNGVTRIRLYEDMWDYDNPANRERQRDFRESVGMDEVAHALHARPKEGTGDPDVEIILKSEDGKRRIHHYLDKKGRPTPKSEAVSVRTFIYDSDGKFECMENRKL